jgi:hypothetical protein
MLAMPPAWLRVSAWWNRFGPLFVADIRRQRVSRMRRFRQWRWHDDEGVPRGTHSNVGVELHER